MKNRKIVSCGNARKIYHSPGCMYVKRILPENSMEMPKAEAEKRGYHVCRYCNSMNYHHHNEEENLTRFAGTRNMELKLVSGMLFIKTEISCWKIVYSKQSQCFVLYHRNNAPVPVDFQHPEKESYHKQADAGTSGSLMGFAKYIYAHDQFRLKEQSGDNVLPMDTRRQKQYAKQAKKKNTYRSIRTVNHLFTLLESQNEEYRKLSFC